MPDGEVRTGIGDLSREIHRDRFVVPLPPRQRVGETPLGEDGFRIDGQHLPELQDRIVVAPGIGKARSVIDADLLGKRVEALGGPDLFERLVVSSERPEVSRVVVPDEGRAGSELDRTAKVRLCAPVQSKSQR